MSELSGHIGQIALTVSDVERALRFYRDILGLPFLFQPSPDLAFLQAGTVRLMLSTPQGAGVVGANSVLYFTVNNISATYDKLVAKGAKAERAPVLAAKMSDHHLWLGFMRDFDGNLLGLMEEIR
ncbi:VOC family protein [Arsukibacterium sp.]|uniref:VOC family protein n=1 Tax=Arsukibacterium sp. TaxID=1977258 RepID=UPI00299DDDF5|nr:VOC family protein [Arsukibacterium sp.]MDX1536234.1 VOC family protein [Arsukibacterium sp.]